MLISQTSILLLVLSLTFALPSYAGEKHRWGDTEIELSAVEMPLSGTLSPLVIDVGGITIVPPRPDVGTLLLNGNRVTTDRSASRAFFARSDETSLRFDFQDSSGATHPLRTLRLPSIGSLRVDSSWLSFHLDSATQIFLDRDRLAVNSDEVQIFLPLEPGWLSAIHVLRLNGGPGVPDRLYNLVVTRRSPEKERPHEIRRIQEKSPPRAIAQATPAPENPSSNCLPTFAALAPHNVATAQEPAFQWRSFELVPTLILERPASSTATTELAWAPTYRLTDTLLARLEAGAMIGRRWGSGSDFIALDYELGLSYEALPSVTLETALGGQTWVNYGGTRFLAAAGFGYLTDVSLLGSLRLTEVGGGLSVSIDSTLPKQFRLRLVFAF